MAVKKIDSKHMIKLASDLSGGGSSGLGGGLIQFARTADIDSSLNNVSPYLVAGIIYGAKIGKGGSIWFTEYRTQSQFNNLKINFDFTLSQYIASQADQQLHIGVQLYNVAAKGETLVYENNTTIRLGDIPDVDDRNLYTFTVPTNIAYDRSIYVVRFIRWDDTIDTFENDIVLYNCFFST